MFDDVIDVFVEEQLLGVRRNIHIVDDLTLELIFLVKPVSALYCYFVKYTTIDIFNIEDADAKERTEL